MNQTTSLAERLAAGGIYEVVRQLPTNNGEFGYRIKSAREPYERAVRESHLRRPPNSSAFRPVPANCPSSEATRARPPVGPISKQSLSL
jgi:hypothetical protein